MVEDRKEHVGGTHPKKIKIKKDPGACCLSLAACGFIWCPRNLAA